MQTVADYDLCVALAISQIEDAEDLDASELLVLSMLQLDHQETHASLLLAQSLAELEEEQTELGGVLHADLPAIREQEALELVSLAIKALPALTNTQCVSCNRAAVNITETCIHAYCAKCTRELCLAGLSDRLFVPARCCRTPIPTAWIEQVLTPTELDKYNLFLREITSIKAADLDPEFAAMVSAFGWKTCPKCGVGIERARDCKHMTCSVCRFEFCDECSVEWRTPRICECLLWNEADLIQAVADIAPRGANAAEIDRLMAVYRNHDAHVCEWSRRDIVRRYKRCYNCQWVCNQWYWRCLECNTNSCGKCAFNNGRY